MPSLTLFAKIGENFTEDSEYPGTGLGYIYWAYNSFSDYYGHGKSIKCKFAREDYAEILDGKELVSIGGISARLANVDIDRNIPASAPRLDVISVSRSLTNLPFRNGVQSSSGLVDIGSLKISTILYDGLLFSPKFSIADAEPIVFPMSVSADLYGPESAYIPRLTVNYQPAHPTIKSLAPGNGGYFPKNELKRLSWDYKYPDNAFGYITQKSYTIEILNGSSTTAKTFTGTTYRKYADIPAGTVTADTMKWRVKSTTIDDIETPWSEWVILQTIDSIPTVTPTAPINTYLDKEGKIHFSWNYDISTGTSQTRADLQYSTDSVIWNDLARVTGASTSADIDSSLLPGGTIYWRVRGYNSDGAAGDWSGAVSFVLRGAPNPPIIDTVTSDPRPTIKWQAVGQISYQLKIGDILDTGETAGTAKSYQVLEYLPKGEYPLQLRIKNDLGQWSSWTNGTVSIRFTAPAVPNVSYTAAGQYVQLTVTNASKFSKLYLLRDGNPVGKFLNGTYWDYTAVSINHYTVRGVDASDRWSDRELTVKNQMPKGILLAAAGKLDQTIWLQYTLNAPRELTSTIQSAGEYIQLAGRRWPVRISSGNDTAQYTILAAEFEKNLRDVLEPLVRTHQTVLYRNNAGNRVYGTINDIEYTDQWMGDLLIHSVGITISQVDFRETIDYDPPATAKAYSLSSRSTEVEILIGRSPMGSVD